MTANEKRSLALSGRKKSAEHVEKVRLANLGRKFSEEHRRKLSEAHAGKPLSESHKLALSKARKGHCYLTADTRAKNAERMRMFMKGRVGKLHPRWITDRATTARKSKCRNCADVTWSSAVRRRFTKCVLEGRSYGECGGRLESHHIETIVANPEKRFDVGNGVTLCRCHHPRRQIQVDALAPLFKQLASEAGKEL